MNNLFLVILAFIFFSIPLSAQFTSVNFEEELVQLNNGEAIPSEKKLLLTGVIPADVNLVETAIFTGKGKKSREALYVNSWLRPEANTGTQFRVPINYKLNSGNKYDFTLRYFKPLSEEQTKVLYQQLVNNLNNYVDQSFQVGKKKLLFTKKTKQIIADLNDVVNIGLSNYRTSNQSSFNGFSDIVRGQLSKIESAKLSKADRVIDQADKSKAKHSYREQMIKDLKKMIETEAQFVLNDQWHSLYREYLIDDVETDKRNGYFAVNVGYGAVFFDGEGSNIDYGVSPYIGLSFPLSTSTIAPKFFRNASITLGVFTNNFENGEEEKITGPIVKRPIYLGLDYKLFQFVRFNAGASFLEEVGEENGQIGGIENRVFVQPFIGLSAKINLSVGLDK